MTTTVLCDSACQFENNLIHVQNSGTPRFASVSIVCPTYNEYDNISPLVERISKTMMDRLYEVIFVDDNSTDGTAQLAMELSRKYPVRVISRDKKDGLASAISTGFAYSRNEIIGVIDADLQHPPESIIAFVEAIEHDSCELAIGSRYIKGGGAEGWSTLRLLISKMAILLARPLVGKVSDPMSGFFFLKRSVIKDTNLSPIGYKLGLEILLKGNYTQVKEIPFIFRKRQKGLSKLNSNEIFLYLRLLKNLYFYKFFGGTIDK